jgi:hypothetical protein
MRQDRSNPSGWNPIGAATPPSMESAPDATGFTPVSPRQPAAGVIWKPEQWASYGHPNWPHGHCFVCGGSIAAPGATADDVVGNHASCLASLNAYSDGLRSRNANVVFPPRPSVDQYRFPGSIPGKSGNSSLSAESADSAEKPAFDIVAEATDGMLIDAVAEYGVVIRIVDIGGDRRFSAEANGKVIASDHFPTWRAAAIAGIARAKGDTLPPDLAR